MTRAYVQFVARHRRFLAFGLAAAFVSSFGQTFFVGQFNTALRETFDLGHGAFGALYSTATLLSALTLVRAGQLIDVTDLRRYTLVVVLGLAGAATLIGSAWAAWTLIPALYLLRLTGQGLMSHISATTMARSFDTARGKALSVAGLGYPLGEALLPSAAVVAIATVGWRATWFGIAAIIALGAMPVLLYLMHGHADRGETPTRTAAQRSHDDGTSWTRAQVVRNVHFYMLLPCALAAPFIVTGFFFHQNHLAAQKGWSAELFASSFTAFAAVQIPVSIAAGPLIDRFRASRVVQFFLIPLLLALVVIALGHHPGIAFVFMGLVGGTVGAAGAILGAMWAELYGIRNHGAIRALTSAIGVFSTAGSPILMGAAIDLGVSMEAIAWTCAGWCVFAVVMARVAMTSTGSPARVQSRG